MKRHIGKIQNAKDLKARHYCESKTYVAYRGVSKPGDSVNFKTTPKFLSEDKNYISWNYTNSII